MVGAQYFYQGVLLSIKNFPPNLVCWLIFWRLHFHTLALLIYPRCTCCIICHWNEMWKPHAWLAQVVLSQVTGISYQISKMLVPLDNKILTLLLWHNRITNVFLVIENLIKSVWCILTNVLQESCIFSVQQQPNLWICRQEEWSSKLSTHQRKLLKNYRPFYIEKSGNFPIN